MGSIVAPSSRASVVGMRPTLGLVSRDRILPITAECDSAGPITRTVTDAAIMITAMAATRDIRDRLSSRAEGLHGTDFTAALRTDGLRGKRIGLLGIEAPASASDEWVIANSGLSDAVQAMESVGARVVVLHPGPFELEGPGFVPEFNWGLREGVNAYLAATKAAVSSLKDVIAFNDDNPGRFAPWGQDRLRDCLNSPLDERQASQIARDNREQARAYLAGMMDENDVDALVGIDTLQSMIYPFAGFPAIAVPAGLTSGGAPFSVTFIGRARADAELLGVAYAYEQASRLRVPPPLPAAGDVPGRSLNAARGGPGSRSWGLQPL
jgi:amidase